MAILDRITIGNNEIIIVDSNPTVVGVDVPLGSLIILNDGTGTFQKIGPLSTDWSLIITSNILSTIITADNGLTKVSNNIQLGGDLTQNTVISTAGFTLDFNAQFPINLDIYGNGYTNGFVSNNTYINFDGNSDFLEIGYGSSGSINRRALAIDSNGMKVNSTGTYASSFKGIEYSSDFSANYVNRSLVDKEYVTSAIIAASQSLTNVLDIGNVMSNTQFITSTNAYSQLYVVDGGVQGIYDDGTGLVNVMVANNVKVYLSSTDTGGVNTSYIDVTPLNIAIDSPIVSINSPSIIVNQVSASRLAWFDSSKNLKSLTGTGLLKLTAGVISFDTNTYLTSNQTITLSGDVTGSGTTSITTTISNATVTGKLLTGLNITGSTIASTDTILQAFGKIQNQINGVLGGAIYQGIYNANTNSPSLVDGTGTKGHYYVVSTAGVQNLGSGNIDFNIGDWAIYNGTIWQKVDNTDAVTSVNGFIGAVSLVTTDINEGTNLYYTNTRVNTQLGTYTGDVTFSGGVSTIGTSKVTNTMLVNNSITIGSTSISLGGTSTTLVGLTSVTSTTFVGSLTGNASTATVLQTSRNINGVAFNGSSDITVTAAAGTLTGTTLNATVVSSSLTSVGTISTGVWNGSVIGTSYTTAQVISVTGTSNRITIGGTSTNPTIDIASTYVGQTSITTLGTVTTATLSNTVIANFSDSLLTIQDNGDATKQANFELSNISTGTTRTISIPDYNGTMILRDSVLKSIVSTTNTTTTPIQTIPTVSNTSYLIEVRIMSKKISGAGIGAVNTSNAYIRTVKARNIAGTVTLSTIQSDFTLEDITTNNVTITVSGTDILVNVIGSTNNNLDWVSITEIIKI